MEKRRGNKRILEILLICAVCFAGLCVAAFLPLDKQYGYHQMLESCGRGDWLYARIFKSRTPVDIAFIGSSSTVCGIQDSLLEHQLEGQPRVANLGFCRYGRPLHFVLMKDLFTHHRPSIVILEVNDRESRFSHPDFPFIASGQDLVWPITRQAYLRQLVLGAQNRVEQSLKKYLGDLPPIDTQLIFKTHLDQTSSHTADPQQLNAKMKIRPKPDGFGRYWVYHTSKMYLRKMVQLASAEGATLKFLYLPSFGRHDGKPQEFDFYRQYGQVLIPPAGIFNTHEYWADGDHLNREGASALSQWLAGQF